MCILRGWWCAPRRGCAAQSTQEWSSLVRSPKTISPADEKIVRIWTFLQGSTLDGWIVALIGVLYVQSKVSGADLRSSRAVVRVELWGIGYLIFCSLLGCVEAWRLRTLDCRCYPSTPSCWRAQRALPSLFPMRYAGLLPIKFQIKGYRGRWIYFGAYAFWR